MSPLIQLTELISLTFMHTNKTFIKFQFQIFRIFLLIQICSTRKEISFEVPNGKKATLLFCCSCHRRSYILLLFFITISVFDSKFIWKSYIKLSFIESIFVMVKDTSYNQGYSLNITTKKYFKKHYPPYQKLRNCKTLTVNTPSPIINLLTTITEPI